MDPEINKEIEMIKQTVGLVFRARDFLEIAVCLGTSIFLLAVAIMFLETKAYGLPFQNSSGWFVAAGILLLFPAWSWLRTHWRKRDEETINTG